MNEETAIQRLSELKKRLEKESKERKLTLEAYQEYLKNDPRAMYPYMSRRDFEHMMEERNKIK